MKIVKSLVWWVYCSLVLLIALAAFAASYEQENRQSWFILIVGFIFLFFFVTNLAKNAIDEFLTRKLGKTWMRALTVAICVTPLIVSVIFGQWQLENTDTSSTSALPPILSIENINFSEKVLDADETATLSIHIKNIGRGDARDLTIHLKSNFQGLLFPPITPVPSIPKKTGQQTVDIQVKGTTDLSTGKAKIEIYLEEPHFEQRIPGKQLTFDTRKPRTPALVLEGYAVVEKLSASPNNRIDVNEEIALRFYVQNRGTGIAEKVKIHVENNQTGVIWLKELDGTIHKTTTSTFPKIGKGDHELISHSYLVNSEFTDSALYFIISATEQHGKYGFLEKKKVAINKKLKPLGKVTPVSIDDEAEFHEPPQVEELPPLKSSGNTRWILLLIVFCFGSFIIIWKRLKKPSDSDARQQKAYKNAAGRKERFK